MNNDQTNHLNMFEGVGQHVTTNQPIWGTNTVFANAFNGFNAHLAPLRANALVQANTTTGLTAAKKQQRTLTVNSAMGLVAAGKAFANVTGNQTLLAAINHSKNELNNASDNQCITLCQGIHDAVAPHISSLAPYGATAANLSAFQTQITTFTGMLGQTTAAQSVTVNATLNIAQHFDAATSILKDQLDPLMEQYKTSHPAFYNEYKTVRKIHDLGHRHTVTLNGFIYDANNNALSGATVQLSGDATHSKITDIPVAIILHACTRAAMCSR